MRESWINRKTFRRFKIEFASRSKLISSILFYSVFFSIQQITGWPILKISGLKGKDSFGDLGLVLRNADCFGKIRWQIFATDSGRPCENYSYGSVLIRILHTLHIGLQQKNLIGWFFILFISIIFGAISEKFLIKSNYFFFQTAILFCSPPIMLLLERGNLDLVMVFGIFLASYCAKRHFNLISFFTLLLITSFKFYTFPLLILTAFAEKKKSKKMLMLVLVVFLFVQLISDFSKIGSIQVHDPYATFGAPVWGLYLKLTGIAITFNLSLLLGWFLFALILLPVNSLRIRYMQKSDSLKIQKFTQDDGSVYLILTFIVCYLLGNNYDYRMIFLILGVSNFYLINKFPLFILYLLDLSAWISCEVPEKLQIVGNLITLTLCVFFFLSIFPSVVKDFVSSVRFSQEKL